MSVSVRCTCATSTSQYLLQSQLVFRDISLKSDAFSSLYAFMCPSFSDGLNLEGVALNTAEVDNHIQVLLIKEHQPRFVFIEHSCSSHSITCK